MHPKQILNWHAPHLKPIATSYFLGDVKDHILKKYYVIVSRIVCKTIEQIYKDKWKC